MGTRWGQARPRVAAVDGQHKRQSRARLAAARGSAVAADVLGSRSEHAREAVRAGPAERKAPMLARFSSPGRPRASGSTGSRRPSLPAFLVEEPHLGPQGSCGRSFGQPLPPRGLQPHLSDFFSSLFFFFTLSPFPLTLVSLRLYSPRIGHI